MRATAVILVVLFHAGLPVRGGFVGVDVFFVISGFVITGMLARELNAAGCIDMRRFYARRVRRILPALALVVVVVVVCAALILSPIGAQQQVAQTGTLAMPMLANVGMINADDGYFARSAEGNALLHIWSLGVEEQFYLAFPAILAMGVWVGARVLRLTRTSSMVGAVTLVLLGSLALCIALTQGLRIIRAIPAPDATAFYSSPARAWEFAAGALVALLDERIGRLPARLLATLGWCGVAVLVWSSVVLTGDGFPGYRALPPVLAAAALIVAGTDPRRSGLVVRGLAAVDDVDWRSVVLVVFVALAMHCHCRSPVARAPTSCLFGCRFIFDNRIAVLHLYRGAHSKQSGTRRATLGRLHSRAACSPDGPRLSPTAGGESAME